MESYGAAFVIFWAAFVIVLYFLPGFEAYHRKHSKAGAIMALNVLLGWTFLGWVAALIWSLTEKRR